MPIRDEELQQRHNRSYLAVREQATLGQVAGALRQRNGQDWWHVIARRDDGSYRVARMVELVGSAGEAPDTPLGQIAAMHTAFVVEKDSMGTGAAQDLAARSPGRVVLVAEQGKLIGMLNEDVMRGGEGLPAGTLDRLAGTSVDLADFGAILLDD